MTSTAYEDFILRKGQVGAGAGFAPRELPDFLFDFQRELVDWSVRLGRAAVFADCGMGKTAVELAWAEQVLRHANRPVLILAPLGVVGQTVDEGRKFGIGCCKLDGAPQAAGIYVTNYERLHRASSADFAGVVCDESSILKSFDGTTRAAVTEFLRTVPYRLLSTATAAPNDYVELGTSSEALGYLGFMDMLSRFFKNNRNNCAVNPSGRGADRIVQWRFRGHAEAPFWRWVASWARAARRPSDLGPFDDARFALPPLEERVHVVQATRAREGYLFSVSAVGLAEEREERRRTLGERCERAASLVSSTGLPAVCWAHLNDEADRLERLIDGSVQVSGRDSEDEKEEKFGAFSRGEVRVLVTKPVIGAWGMNWQHCAHMTTFGGHSYEQYYQCVRRFWRYGQARPVVSDHVLSDGEEVVLDNLHRKAKQADRMFDQIVANMRDSAAVARGLPSFDRRVEVPAWM